MLKQKVTKDAEEILLETVSEHGLCGCKILVGLSGGADSVTLVRVLCALSEKYGFSVSACHINHMIRGKEADRDENFVKELCEKLGIELFSKRFDVPKIAKETKKTLEEAARDVRYSYFSELCNSKKADFIATAHTASDNAETVIFNMTRGCGILGLTGIPVKRDKIIRPLLYTSREEIEDFLARFGQNYVTDSTNLEDDCSRNIIRHKVIPVLRDINPGLISQITNLSAIAEAENCYLESKAKECFTNDIFKLASFENVILSRIIGIMYREKTGYLPGTAHTEILCKEIQKRAKDNCGEKKSFDLPGGITAIFECGKLNMYYKEDIAEEYSEYSFFPVEGINTFCGGKMIAIYCENFDNNTKLCEKLRINQNVYSLFMETKLLKDIIRGKICLRSGLSGDKIRISGMSKDIKKMYSAKKIPTTLRKYLPRITDSSTGEIISLPYVGVCDSQHKYNNHADTLIGLYILDGKE